LQPGLDLFESLGGNFLVERGEDGLALGGGEVFKDVGQFRGVNVGQPLVLDAQLNAPRWIGFNDIDKLPGNGARTEPARDGFQARARKNTFKDPAKRTTQPDLDLGHAQMMSRSMVGPLQINVVHANDLSAVDVDDLAVNEVALQKKEAAFVPEGRDGLGGAQFQCAGWSFQDFLRRHDGQAGAGLEHNARHPSAVRSRGHHNVFELAAQLSTRIGYGRPEKTGETDAN